MPNDREDPTASQKPSALSLCFQAWGFHFLFFCAILAGLWLRVTQLPQQMLFGDEWHAICTASRATYEQILISFGRSDHSIPIALHFKALMDTVGLSEMGIRIPFLAAGALTILVLPLLVRHRVDGFSFILFAWLLALSPTLVFFSRFARPYAIVVLLAFSAVMFFFRWWVEDRMRDAVCYVALTAMAAYLSLVVLPFLLTPFIFFFGFSLLASGEKRWRGMRRLALLGGITAVPLALLILPPLWGDFAAIHVKAGHATIPRSTLGSAFGMLTGVKGSILMTTFGLLMAAGMVRMVRTDRLFLCYLTAPVLIQFAALLIIRPLASDSAHILARYMVPGLPCILLFTAMGLQTLSQNRWVRNRMVQFGIPVAFCLVLFLSGPYPTVLYRPNNAMALMLYLHSLTGADHHWILKRVPAFYQRLAAHPPGALTLVEAPHQSYTDPIPLYQEIHRQHVIKGVANGLWCTIQTAGKGDTIPWSDHLRLATMINLNDPHTLVDRGVDFLIFHKRLQDETPIQLPGYRDLDLSEYVSRYERLFGSPVFEDQDIVAFKIAGKSVESAPSARRNGLPPRDQADHLPATGGTDGTGGAPALEECS
jgi:hypothetical protein